MKDILNSKELNASKKQRTIEELIVCGKENTDSIISVAEELNDKHLAIVLSALESISRSHPDMVGQKGLDFAAKHIDSANNSVKREASRIVGNLCGFYSSIPDSAIRKLLDNTDDESTVVRWSSAYALSRIILTEKYISSDLVNRVENICEKEEDNGVKNQYLKSLKKIAKKKI